MNDNTTILDGAESDEVMSQQSDLSSSSMMLIGETDNCEKYDGTSGKECSNPMCSNCVQLQEKLTEEQKRCTILRENIHKVSANWFHRKTQISESDLDSEVHPVGLLSETTKIGCEEDEDAEEVQSDENAPENKNDKPFTLSKDYNKLVRVIARKSAQLDLADSQVHDLKKRLREYEKIIDHKEDVIHGLKDQLETYLNDNQNMALQLNNLAALFNQLEKVEKESVSPPQQSSETDVDSASLTIPLPTEDEFKEMASSVSRTYIKLKDLIYEKKALVTEIERLNTLNVELQRRVVKQETRLVSVSDALHQTWMVVSDLKEDHEKLHNDELIMRYELKEKREILTRLRKELESARAQWQVIRQKNYESEQEYTSIRAMLQERRKTALNGVVEDETTTNDTSDQSETDEAVCLHPDDAKSFDPPVDLLLEMGLEYGIIGEEAEMTQTVLDVIGGEDVRNNRLEQLEEHCSLLYQKLIASTSRSLSLASRLTRLHSHYGSSDDEFDQPIEHGEQQDILDDDDEEEDDDVGEENEDQYFTDANHQVIMESVLSSPDSEEYDTAYVSETDGADILVESEILSTAPTENLPSTSDSNAAQNSSVGVENVNRTSESSDTMEYEESCDHLSRTLINFLPKKIEILKAENLRLELCLNVFREESNSAEEHTKSLEKDKAKLEDQLKGLTKDVTMESIQRKQLEQQLKHLGKCVDELKLKHQAEKRTDRGCNTDPEDWITDSDSDEQKEAAIEQRPLEEKTLEDHKMKREVELLKKDMELKKKEKELRKREEALAKREEGVLTSDDQNMQATSRDTQQQLDSQDPAETDKSGLEDVIAINSEGFTDASTVTVSESLLLKIVSDMIQENFAASSTEVTQTSNSSDSDDDIRQGVQNENSQSSITSNNCTENESIPFETSTHQTSPRENDSIYSSVKMQPLVTSKDLQQKSEAALEVTLGDREILAIPFHLGQPEQQIHCTICPSQDACLLLLQVQNQSTATYINLQNNNTSTSPASKSPSSNSDTSIEPSTSKSPSSNSNTTIEPCTSKSPSSNSDTSIEPSTSTYSNSTPPTASSTSESSSEVPSVLSSSEAMGPLATLLVPATRVPASTVQLTVLAHQRPSTFVIVLKGDRDSGLSARYRLRHSTQ